MATEMYDTARSILQAAKAEICRTNGGFMGATGQRHP